MIREFPHACANLPPKLPLPPNPLLGKALRMGGRQSDPSAGRIASSLVALRRRRGGPRRHPLSDSGKCADGGRGVPADRLKALPHLVRHRHRCPVSGRIAQVPRVRSRSNAARRFTCFGLGVPGLYAETHDLDYRCGNGFSFWIRDKTFEKPEARRASAKPLKDRRCVSVSWMRGAGSRR